MNWFLRWVAWNFIIADVVVLIWILVYRLNQ